MTRLYNLVDSRFINKWRRNHITFDNMN